MSNEKNKNKREKEKEQAERAAKIARDVEIAWAARAAKAAARAVADTEEIVVSSLDDRLWWIKYIAKDNFALKHRFMDKHDFPYKLKDLEEFYEPCLFDTCCLNPLRYIYITTEEETSNYGQVISLKYTKEMWKGTIILHLKQTHEINLSISWIDTTFPKNLVQQCIKKPGTWFKVPPGSPKYHDSTTSGILPIIDPSGTQISFSQGSLRMCLIGSFASYLEYMGLVENKPGLSEKAHAIMRNLDLLFKVEDIYNKFHHIVTHQLKDNYMFIQNKKFSFQQEDSFFDMPTICVLVGNDNARDHVITVYKKWSLIHPMILSSHGVKIHWIGAVHLMALRGYIMHIH